MTAAAPSHVAWSDVAEVTVLPGITRQTVHGERQSMVRYVYQPGTVFPVHHHAEEQITVVVRGRIEFEVAGRRFTLGPGDVAVIPANVPHGARVAGDEAVETFNALAPRRTADPIAPAMEGSDD